MTSPFELACQASICYDYLFCFGPKRSWKKKTREIWGFKIVVGAKFSSWTRYTFHEAIFYNWTFVYAVWNMKTSKLRHKLHYWYNAAEESNYLNYHGSFIFEQLPLNPESKHFPWHQETTGLKYLGSLSCSSSVM